MQKICCNCHNKHLQCFLILLLYAEVSKKSTKRFDNLSLNFNYNLLFSFYFFFRMPLFLCFLHLIYLLADCIYKLIIHSLIYQKFPYLTYHLQCLTHDHQYVQSLLISLKIKYYLHLNTCQSEFLHTYYL